MHSVFSIKIHRIHCCYKLNWNFFYEEVVGWREQNPMRSQKLLGFQPTQHLCLHPLVWEVAHELTVEFQETDLWKGIIFIPDRNLFEKENEKKREIIVHCTTKRQVGGVNCTLKKSPLSVPTKQGNGKKILRTFELGKRLSFSLSEYLYRVMMLLRHSNPFFSRRS